MNDRWGDNMAEERLVYKSRINKIRSFALILIFVGFGLMYIGMFARKIAWLMILFFVLGVLSILLSTIIYFWIGMLSTKAIPIVCPNCEKHTKILGVVDACMHCDQPLTLDKKLEGKEFDEKYNRTSIRRKLKKEDNNN